MSKHNRKKVSRSNPERPSTLLSDPDSWVYDAFGSSLSSSGVKISKSLALTISAFWRGVNLISTALAKTPIVVYRRIDGGKQRDPGHPAFYVLRRKVNSEMTAYTWKHLMPSHALMHGNGYSLIIRKGSGDVADLIPLDPTSTYPVRKNGQLSYVVSQGGEFLRVLPENMLHFKGFSPDGLQGYSLLDKAKESLGLEIAGTRHFAKFFSHGAHPGTVLEVPGVLKDETAKKILEAWNKMHTGVDNHFRTALLQGGAHLNPFSFSPKDAQFLEARQFEDRQIANWLGVPPHKLGDPARTAYNSLEEENQSFEDDCLDGWMSNFEEELESKLLRERELREDTHVIEFERKALVRANLTTRAAYYRAALGGAPWMTRNEVRSVENMNPLDGGDDLLLPLNMGQGDSKADEVKPDKNAGGTTDPNDEMRMRAVSDVIRRMVKRVCIAARSAQKRGETPGLQEHVPVIVEACAPILALARACLEAQAIAERITAEVRDLGPDETRLNYLESNLPQQLAKEALGVN